MNEGWSAPIAAERRQALARALAGGAVGDDVVARGIADPAADVLAAVARRIGLMRVMWPGVAHPLWLRGGTSDARDLVAAMGREAGDLAVVPGLRRIVEIGAGAGFRSVALAVAHPGATIASVEPLPALTRLHSLNTLPWRQIVGVRAAIAEQVTAFGQMVDPERGVVSLVPSVGGGIGGLSLAALLGHLRWDAVDLLVIGRAACPDLAVASMVPALMQARVVAVAAADGEAVDAMRAVLASHLVRQSGAYVLFERRAEVTIVSLPRLVYAFDVGGAVVAVRRHDVAPEPRGFFPIGDTGFRLHPNPPGAAPARLVVRHRLAGPGRFAAIARVNHAEAGAVRFRVRVTGLASGDLVAAGEIVVAGGGQAPFGFDVPSMVGDAEVEFSTEMADGGSNRVAWAEFLEPGFL